MAPDEFGERKKDLGNMCQPQSSAKTIGTAGVGPTFLQSRSFVRNMDNKNWLTVLTCFRGCMHSGRLTAVRENRQQGVNTNWVRR
tara:strand:+ start:286 stop:540 length:255 start_codon:yes stop_codon:yes gene_type:complete